MGGAGLALMTLNTVLFWGLVVAGVVLLARYFGRGAQAPWTAGSRPTPQQLLAERFARGEIDEDEYNRRRQVLGGTAPTHRPGG
ncbi:SHOCT domain-containing protein [Dactylosporangium roseum]|uniref:SHOCT domain-containing protein n=2 Tax=Dactylosporangium roseum TaxID=47989 RepID=A0ABY5ZG37_9ACTN|nr:SHOCT domain-containing protein [Dactylosporangium roseum]